MKVQRICKKFLKWKEAFESKGQKKTKAIVSGSKYEVLKSKVDSCPKCGKRAMANSMMCTKCGNWVYGRCAKIKEGDFNSGKKFCLRTML